MSETATQAAAQGGSYGCEVYTRRQTFRSYVNTRKYDYGRGSAAGWAFIAFARGDPGFPEIRSWPELAAYVEAQAKREMILGARSVWRSFIASRSLARRAV